MTIPDHAWNESETGADTATGRPVLYLTTRPGRHRGPPYHRRGAFSADNRTTLFEMQRRNECALVLADVATGELTPLLRGTSANGAPLFHGFFALHETTNWIAAVREKTALLLIHAQTKETRVLIDNAGAGMEWGCPCWSLDGADILINRIPRDTSSVGASAPTIYERIRIRDGARERVWEDSAGFGRHTQVCPANDDWLLIDRDRPPGFSIYGDFRASPRAWLLNLRTSELRPLQPNNDWRFQIHTNFNADGSRIYYHGRACPTPETPGDTMDDTPQYVGACDLNGTVLWEHVFPCFHYGHVCAHTQQEAIVTDGLVSRDLLCLLEYEDAGANGRPRIVVLGRHGSDWARALGQAAHPHPVMTPDGQRLLFAAGQGDSTRLGLLQV